MTVQSDIIATIGRVAILIVLIVAIGGLSIIFWTELKSYMKKKLYLLKRWWIQLKEKLWLLQRVWKELKYNYNSHAIEIVFQLYIHFYEMNRENINEGWEFVPGTFTKTELAYLYQWIIETRPKNYEKVKNLDYDFMHQCFYFWGIKYQGLKYKINDEGELKITPLETIEAVHPDTVFQSKVMRINEELFELDTEKAKWIIDRRKYLKI